MGWIHQPNYTIGVLFTNKQTGGCGQAVGPIDFPRSLPAFWPEKVGAAPASGERATKRSITELT
jgi:hypothetical protein